MYVYIYMYIYMCIYIYIYMYIYIFKNLVVFLDEKMIFIYHIEKVIFKVSKGISIILFPQLHEGLAKVLSFSRSYNF